jgi:hypothetical protein
MANSQLFDVGVIDSGTTFTYVPERLFKIFIDHFDWFCLLDPKNHCRGKRIHNGNANPNTICFQYDETKYPLGPKDYFMSYPVLSFQVPTATPDVFQDLKWYPSEYLFRNKPTQYCLAVEKFQRANEVLLGGTFLR